MGSTGRAARMAQPLMLLAVALAALPLVARPAAAGAALFGAVNVSGTVYNVSFGPINFVRDPAIIKSQPWWGNELTAQAAAVSAGTTPLRAPDDRGIGLPEFTYADADGGIQSYFWSLAENRPVREDSSPKNFIRNHCVVTTPPLAVDMDAPTAVMQLQEGSTLSLSITNMSCGAPPCVPSWRFSTGPFNEIRTVNGTSINITASKNSGATINTSGKTLPWNVTLEAVLTNKDLAAAFETAKITVLAAPPPTIGATFATPDAVEGPGTVELTASNITCPLGPCTSTWTVACDGPSFTKLGENTSVTIGIGASFDIKLPIPANCTCSANLTVLDTAAGGTAVNGTSFQLLAVPPPTIGAILATPDKVEGPCTIDLTASNITCPLGPCTSTWSIGCEVLGPSFNRSGNDTSVSVGVGGAFDINLQTQTNYTCSASLAVLDTTAGGTAVNMTSFQVIVYPPIADIAPNGNVNVTAGNSLPLDASGSSCPGTPGNCTLVWSLDCAGRVPVPASGINFTVTTGVAAGRVVNTTRITGVACVATLTVTDGYGLTATTSMSIQVLPALPVCNSTVVSQAALLAYGRGAACAPVKALRNNKTSVRQLERAMRNVANVSFSLDDPQLFATNITFNAVTSNREGPDCGRNRAEVCVPETSALGGGVLQVLPQLRTPKRRIDIGGRMLRITYTAAVPETGLSCSGTVYMCAPPSKRAPNCAPFNSTGVARPVLGC